MPYCGIKGIQEPVDVDVPKNIFKILGAQPIFSVFEPVGQASREIQLYFLFTMQSVLQ